MQVRELKLKIRVFVEHDEDGSYHAYCPDLKGLHVYGDSSEEALEHAREAVGLYASSLLKHDHAIPVGALCSDTTHGSLSSFLWDCVKRKFKSREAKSYIEEISVPQRAFA